MYYSELKKVIDCLKRLDGESLSGVWQPQREQLILGFGSSRFLLLVPKGRFSRIHTISKRPTNPKQPFSFQGACRAYLKGSLKTIQLSPTDREFSLHFTHAELIVRMTGRTGGIWLKHQDTIVASLMGPTPKILKPMPAHPALDSTPRYAPIDGQTWDEAARLWHTKHEKKHLFLARVDRVSRQLKRHEARQRRLHTNLMEDLERTTDADLLKTHADLVGIHLHHLRAGESIVTVTDPMNDDQSVTLKLNPQKSPAENMNMMYAKAKRLERAGEKILTSLERVEATLKKLEAVKLLMDEPTQATLTQVERLLPKASGIKTATDPGSKYWDIWYGPNNLRIYVGKSDDGNRRLISQKSKGDDIWMHIRERPGPHVLIPMKRGKTPSLSLLLIGAQLAILSSKLPEGTAVDVQYAQARHIRLIPGDHLGRVTVQREKVIHIERDPQALSDWEKNL